MQVTVRSGDFGRDSISSPVREVFSSPGKDDPGRRSYEIFTDDFAVEIAGCDLHGHDFGHLLDRPREGPPPMPPSIEDIRDRLQLAFSYAAGQSLPTGAWKETLDGLNDLRVELSARFAPEGPPPMPAYLDTPLTDDELSHCEALAGKAYYVGPDHVKRLINEVRRLRPPDVPYFWDMTPDQRSIADRYGRA